MALSAFAAFADKYESLDGHLPLYTFDVPPSVDNAQVYPAYAVLLDGGTTPGFDFEHNVVESSALTLMIYCDTLGAVDAAALVAKYNGGGTTDGLGLDFGTLPTLVTPYTKLVVEPGEFKHFAAQATGKSAQRIHGIELNYRVVVFRS